MNVLALGASSKARFSDKTKASEFISGGLANPPSCFTHGLERFRNWITTFIGRSHGLFTRCVWNFSVVY